MYTTRARRVGSETVALITAGVAAGVLAIGLLITSGGQVHAGSADTDTAPEVSVTDDCDSGPT